MRTGLFKALPQGLEISATKRRVLQATELGEEVLSQGEGGQAGPLGLMQHSHSEPTESHPQECFRTLGLQRGRRDVGGLA